MNVHGIHIARLEVSDFTERVPTTSWGTAVLQHYTCQYLRWWHIIPKPPLNSPNSIVAQNDHTFTEALRLRQFFCNLVMVVGIASSRQGCRHCDIRTCSGSLHYRQRDCNAYPGICAFVCEALFYVNGFFPPLFFRDGMFSQHYYRDGMFSEHFFTRTKHLRNTFQHGRNVSTTLLNMDGIFSQHYSTSMRCFPRYSIERNVCPAQHYDNMIVQYWFTWAEGLPIFPAFFMTRYRLLSKRDKLFHFHCGVLCAVQLIAAHQLAVNV